MAKQIIMLETNAAATGGFVAYRFVFWFAVPSNARVPKPNLVQSAYVGATAPEIAALQDGSMLEEAFIFQFGKSATQAQLTAIFQQAYADRLAYLSALPLQGQYYGINFNGTAWVPA